MVPRSNCQTPIPMRSHTRAEHDAWETAGQRPRHVVYRFDIQSACVLCLSSTVKSVLHPSLTSAPPPAVSHPLIQDGRRAQQPYYPSFSGGTEVASCWTKHHEGIRDRIQAHAATEGLARRALRAANLGAAQEALKFGEALCNRFDDPRAKESWEGVD
jgi:hypothetical protein